MFGRYQVRPTFHSGYMQQEMSGEQTFQNFGRQAPPLMQYQNPFQMQPNMNWPYMQQMQGYYGNPQSQSNQFSNPYLQSNMNYQHPAYQQQLHQQQMAQPPYNQTPISNESQFLFQNPLQPQDDLLHPYYQQQPKTVPNANPYPKQATMTKQGSGGKSILNSFKSQDGSVDLNKMMDTAGQMMNAVNQVSSLVKGLGSMFKA